MISKTMQFILVIALGLPSAISAQHTQQVPPAQEEARAESSTSTNGPRPGKVASAQNLDGTYGKVTVDGDNGFTGTGVLLRALGLSRAYVVAQPAAPWAGFVVGSAPGAEVFLVRNDGNVGVGTMAPASKLHIAGGTTPMQIHTESPFGIRFRDVALSEGYADGILMEMQGNSLISVSGLRIGKQNLPVVASTGNHLYLTAPASKNVVIGEAGATTKLVVQSAGTSTFAGGISVGGDLIVSGNIGARYQDVAEWVPANEDLGPGTVVVLSRDRTNSVTPSTAGYDTRVAGVVSDRPGLILGEAADDREMIATTGRVRVRVDATVHPIEIGDLLVTSDKAGMAMKSEPLNVGGRAFHQPGTIIGKALEPLAGSVGEILVLLSLQ